MILKDYLCLQIQDYMPKILFHYVYKPLHILTNKEHKTGSDRIFEAIEKKEEKLADIKVLLATANVAAGENTFKKCAACHTNVSGGAVS